MNKAFLIGNLTKDVEIEYTRSGKQVAQFSIGVRRNEDTSDFPSCVAWGKTAELLKKYCHKGSKIAIEGRIQTSRYEKDGKTFYKTTVVVENVEFLNSKSENGKPQQLNNAEETQFYYDGLTINEDDLPY